MKKYERKMVERVILTSVKCDDCGKQCINSFFDIQVQMSFCKKPTLVKTVCIDCYSDRYMNKSNKGEKDGN